MIPGITTRVRYTRLGKIRLGEKVERPGKAPYPKATDHFVFVDAPAVEAVYGTNCTLIAPAYLPGNPIKDDRGAWDFSSFWKTSRSAYGKSSGLFCRSTDGEIATRTHKGFHDDKAGAKAGKPLDPQGYIYIQEKKLDVEVGEMFDMPCPGEECPYFENKMCKNLGVLDLMLTKVAGFGVWTVQTSSFNSIRNLQSMLVMLSDVLGGQVSTIPLALALKPYQAQVDGRAKTIFVLELLCPANLQQLAGLRRRALEAGGSVLAMIEGEVPPEEFYAEGGAALDKQISPVSAVADAAFGPPHLTDMDHTGRTFRVREIGALLGMSKAQIEAEIRKAGRDHIGNLLDEFEQRLEAKGGEVDAEIVQASPVAAPELEPELVEPELEPEAEPAGFTVDESKPMVEEPANIFADKPPGYVPSGDRKKAPKQLIPSAGVSPYDF